MQPDQVEALREAAEEGVEFDGLEAQRDGDGYRLAVPGREWTGLTAAAFDDAAREVPAHVTNWDFWAHAAPTHAARRAFLRWLEGADERDVPARYEALADGVARAWGQLRITVSLGDDGHRRYDLRHEADAGEAVDGLDAFHDPLDAREIVKFDERERYRPLKTAPSLRTGWAFPDLDAAALVEALGFVYPATVENWHREREGELDVSHWRDTAERQTGIYDIVDELEPEAVDRIAATCCVDSQCLKRREWDYDEDHELDAERGEGEFPCREPCSLVVAAARKWTKLEREESRTYEFDLTPSEKEQLEDIVDAVADGRVDEVREADVYEGANRYRARYLREKLFDEEGRLCGVPTEE
ncbi:DR2241 family protein [Halostella litorea]|uniref:DR2241 family protein n=1 Tax=Halostella litorea TaxID=2528831 RepID=UPI0010924201|nr:DR2241 family protein [Halostella litorea]